MGIPFLEILYSIGGFGALAILIWAVRSVKRWGAADAKRKQAEKERDQANENASKLANRPRTGGDVLERLLRWKRKL